MKNIITFTIILMALTACSVFQVEKTESAGTAMPPNIPNPASVDCEIGSQLEIQTAADGSQSIECVFPTESAGTAMPPNMPNPAAVDCEIGKQLVIQTAADGSQSSECVSPDGSGGYMPPESTEEIADWWGVIQSTEPGAQYDDYFVRQDFGQDLYFGIDSLDPAVQAQIVALRDTGKVVHLYGTLFSNVIDYNGSQIRVDRIEVEE
jgi:putative hemolysin